jgi:hypothetical protein
MSTPLVINTTMDPSDLGLGEAQAVIKDLNDLIVALRATGLNASSRYGAFDLDKEYVHPERVNRGDGYTPLAGAIDDRNFPWFLYREIQELLRWTEAGIQRHPDDNDYTFSGLFLEKVSSKD